MNADREWQELRDAWVAFAYQLLKPLIPLIERIPGVTGVKPWVREQQIKERWRT